MKLKSFEEEVDKLNAINNLDEIDSLIRIGKYSVLLESLIQTSLISLISYLIISQSQNSSECYSTDNTINGWMKIEWHRDSTLGMALYLYFKKYSYQHFVIFEFITWNSELLSTICHLDKE